MVSILSVINFFSFINLRIFYYTQCLTKDDLVID